MFAFDMALCQQVTAAALPDLQKSVKQASGLTPDADEQLAMWHSTSKHMATAGLPNLQNKTIS
jgi:hypothetical protein